MNKIHKYLHRYITLNRRIIRLSNELSKLVVNNSTVLDVGAGSGEICHMIKQNNLSINIRGIDVLLREQTRINVELYDGTHLPFDNNSFDYVFLIDVLHHTPDPLILLNEANRVARKGIILKDHNCNNTFHERILKLTDWFGNAQFGVKLEYNFWSRLKWVNAFSQLKLKEEKYLIDFNLYPKFTRILFWKDLDFISLLVK